MSRVVHINDHVEGAVYIGRFNGRAKLKASPFGNPFSVKDYGRDEAIRLYRHWLFFGATGSEVLARLPELRGVPALSCWCRRDGDEVTGSNACHADVLLDLLDRYTDDQLQRLSREPWKSIDERLADEKTAR